MIKFIKRYHPFKITFAVILFFLVLICSFCTFKAKTADIKGMESSLRQNTLVYDKNNKYAGALINRKGTYVDIDKISPNIKNAIINTEDRTFYTNHGFSITGTSRAILGALNPFNHNGGGGGSTLSQQLIKNMFLTQKKTISRKFEELFYSIQLNRIESKDKIFEMYLNNAYFSYGVWGVEDASMRYFGVHASEVSVAQGASICAMLANPGLFNPISYPEYAIKRRNLILDEMKKDKVISEDTYKNSINQKLIVNNRYSTNKNKYLFPSYFDAVIEEAKNHYGIDEDSLLNNGYKIYTNLDQDMQQKMENYYRNETVLPTSFGDQAQSASIVIDNKTGGVNAVIGNANDNNHLFLELNRATQMNRQVGSTLKPIVVYIPALTKGYSPDSLLQDKLVSYNGYEPKNYNNTYQGQVTLKQALENSLNAPAVWLLNKIGIDTGISSLENFGFSVPKDQDQLGLALGSLNVTPIQIAQAYQIIANNGLKRKTHFINKIETSNGKIVQKFNDFSNTVVSPNTLKLILPSLKGVFNEGTGVAAKPSGIDVAGKTGSTQTSEGEGLSTNDQWVAGFTPDITLTTWVGFDDPKKGQVLSDSNYANYTFRNILQSIYPDTLQTSFDNNKPKVSTTNSNNNSTNYFDLFGKGVKNIQDSANSLYQQVIDFFH